MVTVRVSETYDLSTKVGKMAMVGIHTPTGSLIDRLWGGLVLQYKKFRFVKADVSMACASMLPADPLQIGVEAGAIAPQDMFNPILYSAVSNDSMSRILGFVMGEASGLPGSNSTRVNQGSIVDINDAVFKSTADSPTDVDQFNMYYGLLSNPHGFKKAMPQAGLQMKGLYPIVYQMLSSFGYNQPQTVPDPWSADAGNGALDGQNYFGLGDEMNLPNNGGNFSVIPDAPHFRGRSCRMPAVDTTFYTNKAGEGVKFVPKDDSVFVNSNTGRVPPAYVGLIILPPAKLNQLYYRLKVTWTIEFMGLRSMSELKNWDALSYIGEVGYATDYAEQSANMSSVESMVDTSNADMSKVMEGI